MPDRKPTGASILMDRDADSKVVAEAAAAEGGTKEGTDFRAAAGAAAAGVTRIRGIASRGIITKEIIIKIHIGYFMNDIKKYFVITNNR